MPGGDRTGPMGMGSMTGRGMGICAGRSASMMYPGGGRFARGCGMGFGGHGRRNRFYATGRPGWAVQGGYAEAIPEIDEETAMLKNQARNLQQAIDTINKRLEELESAKQ